MGPSRRFDFLPRAAACFSRAQKSLAGRSVGDNRLAVDAQHKVLQAAGLSPLSKRRTFLVPDGNKTLSFAKILLLTIVRPEQKVERSGLLGVSNRLGNNSH